MTWENPTNEEVANILQTSKTISVVDLSNNLKRTSYQISKAMQDADSKINPFNTTIEEVLGERAYRSLEEIEEQIDIINVFRRSEYLLDIAREALHTNANVFWAQQGVINEDAYKLLKENEFTVIMDLCIKVAHAVLPRN